MTDLYADIEKRLQELRSRMELDPALAAELAPVASSLESLIVTLKQFHHETGWRLKLLEKNQTILNARVESVENSLIFRFLRGVGRPFLEWKARVGQWRTRIPFRDEAPADVTYEDWLQREQEKNGTLQGDPEMQLSAAPLFSFVLRLQQPVREYLEQTLNSVTQQTYPHWELAIYGAGSASKDIAEYLANLSLKEPRVRICGFTERPGEGERGEYVAFLQQHDLLAPTALKQVARVVKEEPADLIYTDEDRLTFAGRHVQPIFKPDWSPELLLACDYTGGLMVIAREALRRIGGFRDDFENAGNYDLVLRLSDGPSIIRHVPAVLYHARTMKTENDSETAAARRRALEDTLRRRNWKARVEQGSPPGRHRVCWMNGPEALVSVIICSRSPVLLGKCLERIEKGTEYSRRELIVVNHVTPEADVEMEKLIRQYNGQSVRYSGPFNFSRMNNLAATAASGEVLIFLNDDVEPLTDDWMRALVAQAQRCDVGAAGARLLYPSGSLQHAGITIGIGDGCGHVGRGTYGCRYWPWLDVTRDVSAVTGACLAIRKGVFREAGGFDERFADNHNDVDLCLRLRRAGYRVVYESSAVLRHYECQTRRGGVTMPERQQWYASWADEIDRGDPFYSPNLSQILEDASLRTE